MSWHWLPDPKGTFSHRIQFLVPELPMSHKRAKAAKTKAGFLYTYTKSSMLEYQARVRNAFYAECVRQSRVIDHPWDNGPVVFSMIAYFPKARTTWFEGKDCEDPNDCDNLAKMVQDALNGRRSVKLMTPDPLTGRKSKQMVQFGAWIDDKQVISLHSTKDYHDETCSLITMDFWHRNERPRKRQPR